MILQALTRYYEDLLAQGKIDAPGWAPAKISFALYLDENGGLTQVVPTMEDVTKGKKTVQQPQSMALPAAVKRTVGIAANFLWDNSSYLLGIDQKGKPERSRNCFAAAAKLHHAVLDGVDSPVAHSILAFFDNWKTENAAEHPAEISCSALPGSTRRRTPPSERRGSGIGRAAVRMRCECSAL